MREFEQKKKLRKVLYSRTTIFILFLIVLFLAQATWKVYKKEKITRDNLNQVADEYKKLETREHAIKSSVDFLQTDKGVESEIRSKFRAVKPGEQVAIIINDEVKKEVPPPPPETFWMKVKKFFDIL